jgi:hypothetical protein
MIHNLIMEVGLIEVGEWARIAIHESRCLF